MVIRPFDIQDVEEIDRIYQKYFSDEFYLPSLKNTVTHAVVSEGDKILGFGEVKLFAEAILVMDKAISMREKYFTIRALMLKAIEDSRKAGLDQLHLSVQDSNFADILIKHYGFVECKGRILAKEL